MAAITSRDWSFSVDGIGQVVQGIEDIAQCINIILSTQKGTDPFRPTFGVDVPKFLDRPVNIAIPNLIREISEQVKLWEPRATITRITHELDVSALKVTVEFDTAYGNGSTLIEYRRNG